MFFNKKFKDEKENNQDNFLLYIPIRKHEQWEVKNGLVYLIFYHNKLIERFLRWLVKKPNVSDIELDDRGSTVWKSIDGKNTVYDIIKVMSDKYGDDEKTSNEKLIMFLRYLSRRGWISFNKGKQ